MTNPQSVADRIKTAAKLKGVSVAEMLRECQLNKDLISTTQSKGYFPRMEALLKIADYLDVSLDYLTERTGNPEINK